MMMASLHGFALWFDVSFGPRIITTEATDALFESSPMENNIVGDDDAETTLGRLRVSRKRTSAEECVILSTAPEDPPTHWAQTILYVYDPIMVTQDQLIYGSITLSQSRENPRFLNIHLEYTSGDRHCVKESVMR
jgi:protein arginine N-methyltransferase 6